MKKTTENMVNINTVDSVKDYVCSVLGEIKSEDVYNYLWIIQDIQKHGFQISDLKSMFRTCESVFNNSIYIYDIDISETMVTCNCIFFDAFVTIRKNKVKSKIHIRFNCYKGGDIKFIETIFYDCYTYICRQVFTFEKLKEVINEFSQGD